MNGIFAAEEGRWRTCDDKSFLDIEHQFFGESPHTADPFNDFLGWMKVLGSKCVFYEILCTDGEELAYEREAASHRTLSSVNLSAYRLTFFAKDIRETDFRSGSQKLDEVIVGYAVILTYEILDTIISVVHEAVVRWPPLDYERGLADRENYYVHCIRAQHSTIGTKAKSATYELKGAFFCQANGFTSVCSHSAIRCALNSSPHYRGLKVTNKQLNAVLGFAKFGHLERIDGEKDEYPHGLKVEEIRLAIKGVTSGELTALSYETRYDTPADFDRFVYPFMECGYPIILGLNGHDFRRSRSIAHVVTVLGHTLNADRWAPEASACYGQPHFDGFHPACDWTDHYVINDDRQGIYATVQSEILRPVMLPAKNPWLHPIVAVAIVPHQLKVAPHTVERLAVKIFEDFLNDESVDKEQQRQWRNRLRNVLRIGTLGQSRAEAPMLVTRAILFDKQSYISRLKGTTKLTPEHSAALDRLPPLLAVCEVSLPSLYTVDVTKIGEVVFDISVSPTPESEEDDAAEGVNGAEIATTARLLWCDGMWVELHSDVLMLYDWPLAGPVPMHQVQSLSHKKLARRR